MLQPPVIAKSASQRKVTGAKTAVIFSVPNRCTRKSATRIPWVYYVR